MPSTTPTSRWATSRTTCLPGVPEQMITSTLRFAANIFFSAADAVGLSRGDRMSGLCKQATTTIDSLSKRLLSLLQLPIAEIDDDDFSTRSFTGADLQVLAPYMSLSMLRGAFIMHAQTCTRAPLLVEATVEGRGSCARWPPTWASGTTPRR